MLAIYKKELRSYFTTMIGFIYAALFLAVVGIYFVVYNIQTAYSKFEYVLADIQFLYIILIPILTMRLIAEEKKQKTDQLLLTSPISVSKIVFGKYLAAYTMYLLPMVLTAFYPVIIAQYGNVNYATAYSALFGFILLGATYMSLGLFVSSVTENQVIALIVTAIALLVNQILPGVAGMIPTDYRTAWIFVSAIVVLVCLIAQLAMHNVVITFVIGLIGEVGAAIVYFVEPSLYDGIVAKILHVFSVSEKYDNFSNGILDFNAILYFLSIIAMFLLLTIQVIKKKRWN